MKFLMMLCVGLGAWGAEFIQGELVEQVIKGSQELECRIAKLATTVEVKSRFELEKVALEVKGGSAKVQETIKGIELEVVGPLGIRVSLDSRAGLKGPLPWLWEDLPLMEVGEWLKSLQGKTLTYWLGEKGSEEGYLFPGKWGKKMKLGSELFWPPTVGEFEREYEWGKVTGELDFDPRNSLVVHGKIRWTAKHKKSKAAQGKLTIRSRVSSSGS